MHISYEPSDNIFSKWGIGSYSYDADDKPHAVRSVDNDYGWIPDSGKVITYNAFGKVSHVTSTVGTYVYTYDITYGPDRQRWFSVLEKNGSLVRLTEYHDGYDYVYKDGVGTYYYYINGADGLAVVYTVNTQNGEKGYYVEKDHLGTIRALYNNFGQLAFAAEYDPWGQLSLVNNASYIPFYRGFTGHEHLDELGLIDMNGRMYDPLIGRFLSPDPFIQLPDYSQSFNRYSYCINNPLKYTDPSGNLFGIDDLLLAASIGYFVNVTLQTISGNINSVGDYFLAAGIGALGGAGSAFVGVTVAGAIGYGGFAGGATIGAASGFTGGFVTGAGNAWMNGASFGDGLGAGLIGGGIGALTGGVAGGFARGISDYRNGYSFWNGSKVDEFVVGSAQYEKIANGYNSSGQADMNDEILQMRMQDEFGVGEGDFNIQDITTRTGKGYGMTNSGRYVNFKSGNMVGGYVKHFSTGYSDFHISPYYSNGDAIAFRAVVGHELIHAYHYYALPNVSRIYTERVAYKYTHDVYLSNGRFTSALSTMNTAMFNSSGSFWGPSPAQYQIPSPYRFY